MIVELIARAVVLICMLLVCWWVLAERNRLISCWWDVNRAEGDCKTHRDRGSSAEEAVRYRTREAYEEQQSAIREVIASRHALLAGGRSATTPRDPADSSDDPVTLEMLARLRQPAGMKMLGENYPSLDVGPSEHEIDGVFKVEANISAADRARNDAINAYNKEVLTFPGSVVARLCGFAPIEVAQMTEEERAARRIWREPAP